MDSKQTTKHLVYSIFLIVFIFGAFVGGYVFGSEKAYHQFSVPTLANKEAVNIGTTNADFAPFWKAWNVLNEKFVSSATTTDGGVTDQEKVWGAISGLAGSYGDPYTSFFPPAESKDFTEQISGNFGGIGAELDMKEGALVVVSPLKGSPAERSGLRAEDTILAVDGKSVSGSTIDESISIIRGEIGTKVTLTVVHRNENEAVDIEITRDNIQIPIIDTEHRADDGVFVISLYSFSANSAYQFRDALQMFADSGETKLVIDLRNNPGGYLESAMDMASWFLPEGDVVVTEDFGGSQESRIYRSKGYNVFKKGIFKIAVLQNGGSASASEILAGALQEHGNAVIVGTQSFGKGSVQELVDITPETSLKVTVAKWLTPKGNFISGNGLTPDFEIEFDVDKYLEEGIDTQLEKAIEVLK